ncbi:MAG TPA: glycosyltransferase family 4 protein [Tepidisphaeraceae bacterium]
MTDREEGPFPLPIPAHALRSVRVLLVVESAGGGTGRHVLDLAEGLIARGCEVHLIYSTGRMDKLFEGRLSAMKTLRRHAIPMRTGIHPSDFAVARKIRNYLREHGPFDAIHGHSSKGGALARLAAFGTGTPAHYTLHGLIMMDPGLARWKRMFYLAVELALSLRTARIVAVSPEEARAATRLGLDKSRVVLIPNGVGPAKLTPRADARRELGVSSDSVVTGFVGRLVDQKAPDVLLRAFARAVDAAPNARLAMVGAGPLEGDLRALSQELNIADKIIWLGERDAREVLAAFDIFALSSRKEGLPYVVLEAMAAGLPVVATSSAGVEILIEPGVSGNVIAPNDAIAFGDALARLSCDGGLRHRFGQAALERAGRFSVDAMVDRTLVAYLSGLDDESTELATAQ